LSTGMSHCKSKTKKINKERHHKFNELISKCRCNVLQLPEITYGIYASHSKSVVVVVILS